MFLGIFGMDSSVAKIYSKFDKIKNATQEERGEIKENVRSLIKYYCTTPQTDFKEYILDFASGYFSENNLSQEMIEKFNDVSLKLIKKYLSCKPSPENLKSFVLDFLKEKLSEEEFTKYMSLYRDYDCKKNVSQITKYANRTKDFDVNSLTDVDKLANLYYQSYLNFQKFNACTIEWDLSFEHAIRGENQINMEEAKINYDYLKLKGKLVRALACIYPSSSPKFNPPVTTKEEFLKIFGKYLDKLNEACPNIDYLDFFNELSYDRGMHEIMGEISQEVLSKDIKLEPSIFEELFGEDYYIELLKIAKEKMPNTKLLYNEFGHECWDKTKNILKILNKIHNEEERLGIKLLDGVGIQCRLTSEDQNLDSIEFFIEEVLKMGYTPQITECDVIKVTKNANGTLIKDADQKQQEVYQKVFNIAQKYKDQLAGFTLGDFNDITSFSSQVRGKSQVDDDMTKEEKAIHDPSPTLFDKEGKIKGFGYDQLTNFCSQTNIQCGFSHKFKNEKT